MVVGTACLAQLLCGVALDRRYDRSVSKSFLIAPLYPLGYWLLMAVVTVVSTLPALLRRQPSVARWSTVRETRQVEVPAQRTAEQAAAPSPERVSA
jgi:hypothetical protein